LGDFVIRLLLYADDLILIAKSALGLQEHLISLECFCSTMGMQVNTSKTKVVIFSSKRKHKQHKFYFEGNTLEEVVDYKYPRIDFNKNLSWEGCRKKRTLGGWKAFYAFQNRCREAKLMGLEDYANSLWAFSDRGGSIWLEWKQIEKIQKRLITNKFKFKSSVPYDIMLSEMGAAPIEAIAMVRLIRYLKQLSKWKTVGGLRSSSMTYCAKGRIRGCDKTLNGLVNGIST
jgi:hypothetical protein